MLERIQGALLRVEERLKQLEKRVETALLPPSALTIEKAAHLLSCSPSKVKGLLRTGEIRFTRLGGSRIIPMSEIVRLTAVTAKPRSSPQLPAPPPRPHAPTRPRMSGRKQTPESVGLTGAAAAAALRERKRKGRSG